MASLAAFDPLVRTWFEARFSAPTPAQSGGWPAIAAGGDTLIAAPTGSGKTLAAFLWAIDKLVRAARGGTIPARGGRSMEASTDPAQLRLDGCDLSPSSGLPEATHILYVSPLKALGNDIEKNLRGPLAEIHQRAVAEHIALAPIRVAVRSGDTKASSRSAMLRHPPHILITTPESLYILLTAEGSRRMLASTATVIVDEIHAVAGDKRGAHLALSLERLDALVGRPVQRIGLSATQRPIDDIARLLVGAGRLGPEGNPRCTIVDTGHRRAMQLSVEAPTDMELGPIATHEIRAAIDDRIAALSRLHRTTIVFVHTRRLVERVAHSLAERLGADQVVAHHGSLARGPRLAAEASLRDGRAPVCVATASLELGIDIGHVDLVCQVGAPRALATLLQRVGRSGHWLGAVPRGIFLPLTRDDLLQAAAAVRAVRAGELDLLHIREAPLDVLAQQIVAWVATGEQTPEDLFERARRAWPYRDLEHARFQSVLEMLCEGVSTRRSRRSSARLHHDAVHGRLRARRGTRLVAITGGGAIPDRADYDVVEEPSGTRVGRVDEDFAIDSMRGDVFALGNHSWRILRIETGKVRVADAGQTPPSIPFWFGEAPPRTAELSRAVGELRWDVATRLVGPREPTRAWLEEECGLDAAGAEQLIDYVDAGYTALGTVPTWSRLVVERFFDQAGGMQLVVHSPRGGGINRALGLALRKRFCLTFDFELQAAATDDGVLLSLGEQHSFPIESTLDMLRRETARADLVQAALKAPMFTNRWRWNATRALVLARFSGGRKVPVHLQRMRAEDLLAAVFPAQIACGDNHAGPIEAPDHPLVEETLRDCLVEAMDASGLEELLDELRQGTTEVVFREMAAPSPFAHELLSASPWAFLDDAPLEERRARAVSLRHVAPAFATEFGRLDAAAIAEVRLQAWPDVRSADELHDALLDLVWLPLTDAGAWTPWLDELMAAERAVRVRWTAPAEGHNAVAGEAFAVHREFRPDAPDEERCSAVAGEALVVNHEPRHAAPDEEWRAAVAVERLSTALRALGPSALIEAGSGAANTPVSAAEPEEAIRRAVGGWMEMLGPMTAAGLAARLGLATPKIESALARLESEGSVLRGTFDTATASAQWCERRLLARIHRRTLDTLRREIEPVELPVFLRFLLRWQHLAPGTRLHGSEGLEAILRQLAGFELPAACWEEHILPARLGTYEPGMLDALCLGGVATWGRFSTTTDDDAAEDSDATSRRRAPARNAKIGVAPREMLDLLLSSRTAPTSSSGSEAAAAVLAALDREGASFPADLARATGLPRARVDEALWELAARGLATADGFGALRHLLESRAPAPPEESGLRVLPGRRNVLRHPPAGRWTRLRARDLGGFTDASIEAFTEILLRRWGVLVRELLARESAAPPWRAVLATLRRLEMRGVVRGGRFIAGLTGEQFALPEAVVALRAARRLDLEETIVLSAADPLNLLGILTPGPRLPANSGRVLTLNGGLPQAA